MQACSISSLALEIAVKKSHDAHGYKYFIFMPALEIAVSKKKVMMFMDIFGQEV
jgi:hypothetical protein